MLLEILVVVAFVVVIFLLWKILGVLVRTGRNQSDQATFIMQELELIRAGGFVVMVANGEEGWSKFDEMAQYIAREYIRPDRMASALRAEGKTQEQINNYIAAARKLEENGES